MENPVLWTPDLSIGVDEIDEQHKEMIARVNQLQTTVREGRAQAELGKIIEFTAETQRNSRRRRNCSGFLSGL